DGDHAIDVGVLAEQVRAVEALGDVLAGAGRAVDCADDGDVIAGAVAQVFGPVGAAVVAHPGPRLGFRGRRGPGLAEGVVAFEGVGRAVVDVDVVTGGDVLAGEADDLPVFQHRRAPGDRLEGDLVPHADAAGEGDGRAAHGQAGARREVPGGDG